jgi:hypothetical protein
MRPALIASVAFMLLAAGTVHSDEDLTPEQRIDAIEQHHVSGERREKPRSG